MMKLFTVTKSGIKNGIQVEKDRFYFVSAGEEGRGRKKVRLPLVDELGKSTLTTASCPKRGQISMTPHTCDICGEEYTPKHIAFRGNGYMHTVGTIEAPGMLQRASIIKTKAKGTLLLVPERDDDKKALVKLAVEAGFRGATKVEFSDGVEVLKEGVCAQGAAGRMGSHREYLIVMNPGTYAVVERFGRLYGAPSVIRVDFDGEELCFRSFHSIDEMEEELELIDSGVMA